MKEISITCHHSATHMTVEFPLDVHCLVVCLLPVVDIFRSRAVNSFWKRALDEITQKQWRHVYRTRVCDFLCVPPTFDWRRATVVASRNAELYSCLDVWCTWKQSWLCLAPPWLDRKETPLSSALRDGVVRLSVPAATHSVDFVYEGAFRLRGWVRTCVQRQSPDPCSSCRLRTKQRCLNRRYEYYIRRLYEENIQPSSKHMDECLSVHLSIAKTETQ